MARTYDVGQSVKLTFEVYVDDQLRNATVALQVTRPDGTNETVVVNNDGTGQYSAVVTASMAGLWLYRWNATGAAVAAADGAFTVAQPLRATLYITVPELREALGDSKDAASGERLEQACAAASRAIDRYCRRRFWQDLTPQPRLLYPSTWTRVALPDLASATGVTVETDDAGTGSFATLWPAGSYQLEPLNAAASGGAYHYSGLRSLAGYFPRLWSGRPGVRVTGRWGWSQPPEEVGEAARLLAVRLYTRKDTPLGLEGGYTEFGPVRITSSDPDVRTLLEPYRRVVVA